MPEIRLGFGYPVRPPRSTLTAALELGLIGAVRAIFGPRSCVLDLYSLATSRALDCHDPSILQIHLGPAVGAVIAAGLISASSIFAAGAHITFG